jgi:cytochrome c biogenesis protein CcmG/thiol:disulfide interchange protein DsbE
MTPTNDHQQTVGDTDDVERRRPRTVLVTALTVGVVVVAFAALLATRDNSTIRATQSPLVGQLAPPTNGTTLAGDEVSLDDFRGRWVAVNFFASWCTPCILEHPELVAFDQEGHKTGKAALLSITFDNSSQDAKEFFDKRGGDWPVIDDPDNTLAVAYGVTKVPETYLVAPDGTVVYKTAGQTTKAELDQVIDSFEQRNR